MAPSGVGPGPAYFEDFQVGTTYELGSVTVTAEEIVAFAGRFDPQPFHTDPEAARESAFGGLVASGWHTCSLFMRLYCDTVLLGAASMGSPGVEQVRWLVPVRPGDTLRGRSTVLEATPSTRHPERGTILSRSEMLNQHDEVAVTMTSRGLFGRRLSNG